MRDSVVEGSDMTCTILLSVEDRSRLEFQSVNDVSVPEEVLEKHLGLWHSHLIVMKEDWHW